MWCYLYSYCWRRCCHDDAGWLLPDQFGDGQLNKLYYGNFNSCAWLVSLGALLVIIALFHPKAACSERPTANGGCKCITPFWLLDPFTRVGGIGFLFLVVAGAGGGGYLWFDRIFLLAYAICKYDFFYKFYDSILHLFNDK